MASGAPAGIATRGRRREAQGGAPHRLARGHGTPTILLACSLGVAACTTTSPLPSGPEAAASPITVEPSPSASADDAAFERVQFVTSDGVELNGRLWGAGSVGVILAHGFSELTGQDDWRDVPDFLAQRGLALTFTFRGFCDREGCAGERDLGANWLDVVAATEYLQARDVDTIFAIGASMGGLAVLRAAQQPEIRFAGVVSLSTPQWPSVYYSGEPEENDLTPELLAMIEEPKLFVAGIQDVQTPEEALIRVQSVRFADDARAMFDVAREPKQLELIESGAHSSELVTSAGEAAVTQTRDLIIEFIETHAAGQAP